MDEMARMRRARTMLLMHHPFFGYLASKLQLKESKLYPTMATDGRHLFFNPDFTRKLTNNQTLTGVAHETMHPACLHNERRGSRDPEKWNKAGDYAINLMLKDSQFPPIDIPGVFKWLCDDKWKGMVAEKIYDQLPDDPPRPGCVIIDVRGAGAGDSKEGEGQGDGQGQPDTSPADPNQPPPVNWKRALVEAANFAKMRGKLPAGMEEFVDKITKPRINWKRAIRNTLVSCCRTDWTYSRPNRRYAHLGISMPVSFGYTAEAECWLDSSGSIGLPLFQTFLGAVIEIAEQLKIKLNVGVCDAQVQLFEKNVKDTDILKKIKFRGRGGTTFVPPFEHAKKRKPKSFLYFTDLYGDFPDWRPSWQTLWVAPHGAVASGAPKPPFGRVLELPEDVKEDAA